MLFANETETATAVVTEAGFFPPYFGTMLVALVVVFAVVMLLFLVGYRVINWITPGDLCKELLGHDPKAPPAGPYKPNVALAIVVAAMLIGVSLILGLTVHGVLTH